MMGWGGVDITMEFDPQWEKKDKYGLKVGNHRTGVGHLYAIETLKLEDLCIGDL